RAASRRAVADDVAVSRQASARHSLHARRMEVDGRACAPSPHGLRLRLSQRHVFHRLHVYHRRRSRGAADRQRPNSVLGGFAIRRNSAAPAAATGRTWISPPSVNEKYSPSTQATTISTTIFQNITDPS